MKYANDIQEQLYQAYQEIDYSSYQEKIRFFEGHLSDIDKLAYSYRLELSLEYVVALFEVGEYYQYLNKVDALLTKVMEDNIYSVDGDDIYQELLYRKAASLHNIVDYYACDHVLSQLVRIDSKNNIYKRTFMKNSIDFLRYQGQKVRAAIVALFILSGIIIGVELLAIRPFFPESVAIVEASRNIIFAVAVFGILFQELRIRYISWNKFKTLIK